MAEDAFVTDFEHIMADDITDDVRFIMYDSASGKTASAGEVSKYMMRNIHVDPTLTEEGSAAEAKAVGDALATKADTKGTYEDLIVGGAEQLMADEYETDKDPYLFRTTGGSADVGNREYLDKIVGGTVAWNQLCNGSSVTVQSGHKYLLKKGTAWSIGASTGTAITGLTSGSDMLFDFTAMFGTTIADYIYSLEQSQAGAGVAWFRNYFPKDYYPYDKGTLRSVEGVSAHVTSGKNLLPPSTTKTLSGIKYTVADDGRISISGTASAEDGYVIPFTVQHTGNYYFSGCADNGSFSKYDVYVWDSTNAHRAYKWDGSTASDSALGSGDQEIYLESGITYQYRIRVRKSFSASSQVFEPMIRLASINDATYEPYAEPTTYPLDSSLTLRGVPRLVDGKLAFDGDIYPPSGEVQRRYGIVDLGTLTWSNGGGMKMFFSTGIKGEVRKPSSNSVEANWIICQKLMPISYDAISLATAGRICISSSCSVGINDGNTYDSVDAFKAAMSGVYLVYEKTTPTTETADGYERYQKCDPSGTEEFVTTGIVPVGHETRYPHDLKKKIETAPDSPSTDGTYLMKRSGGKNAYMALPSTPSANGAYVLTVTVSGGSASYSWTAKE